MRIEGSVALVTGANRGLGKSIVDALLEAGAAKVYAAARDQQQIAKEDPRVVALRLDITDAEQIAAAVKAAGDVTLLINNAGVMTSYDVLTMSRADFEMDLRVNVLGTLEMTRAFVPVLQGRDGAVVNISSLGALASVPSMGGYAASKAAAYSMTQALRPALKAKGIALHIALAGPIDTDMIKAVPAAKASPKETAEGLLAGIERGEEDIFPDPIAQQMRGLWGTGPKELERAFAGF